MKLPRFMRAPKSVWAFRCLLVVLIVGIVTVPALFTATPWTITFLEIGRVVATIPFLKGLIGPVPILEYGVLALFVSITLLVSFLVAKKLRKDGSARGLVLTLVIYLMISSFVTFSFSLVFMPQVSQAGEKIDTFVAENGDLSTQDYVESIAVFLNENLGKAYNRPEESLMINRIICNTIIDPHVMKIWGATEVDLILYQGWGSCEEAAILTEELLHGAGYETRLAHFKGIDHEWAEVKHNGTWWIVDPWYIGKLVEAQTVRNIKPAFQNATGVEIQYTNGTVVDASQEHGY